MSDNSSNNSMIEQLKAKRSVSWVDEKNFKKGEFGPPLYDESSLSY